VGTSIEYEEEEEEIIMDVSVAVLPSATIDFPLKCPTLFALLGGKKEVAAWQLQAIFHELLAHFGKSNTVGFIHGDGKKARAVVIPQVKDKESFIKQARKQQWVESILEHVTGGTEEHDKVDAAEWLVTYLGRKYDASFILASEALGLPLVQRLDEASTEAMWSDTNVNVVQQHIIRRHLKFHFGKRLFLPQRILKDDQDHYEVETQYGSYKFYKNGDTAQKPEKRPYWLQDASAVVKTELSKLLDYLDPKVITSKFSSINNHTCTIVAGADQGQGAW
jgi:hypothetical protein